ncbi:hypothetical protein DPMN_165616 [Dreissena polymorpha]|uniref:Uncharacterized protein n=1 Tax=Dreissena polymorpha TaxID=45954 RepID=A0A9D4IWS7_DREPO|nr:hypothetical protein DPMN_165616 [Dreissena polymorpha]
MSGLHPQGGALVFHSSSGQYCVAPNVDHVFKTQCGHSLDDMAGVDIDTACW